MPTLLINDAQAAGWAEYQYGSGSGARAMAFVTVSTGIGGAFVLDGRLQVGARGLAGHFGHVVIADEGLLCGCGRHGCIERYVRALQSLHSPRSNTMKRWMHRKFFAGRRAANLSRQIF